MRWSRVTDDGRVVTRIGVRLPMEGVRIPVEGVGLGGMMRIESDCVALVRAV